MYPQTITYINYCHAKLQLKVILGSLWGHCGVFVGRYGVVMGSLWVVVGSLWGLVGRCGSFSETPYQATCFKIKDKILFDFLLFLLNLIKNNYQI